MLERALRMKYERFAAGSGTLCVWVLDTGHNDIENLKVSHMLSRSSSSWWVTGNRIHIVPAARQFLLKKKKISHNFFSFKREKSGTIRTRTLQTRTGSTLMTAAGDSTCSQLKQDTHILRLKFQIFSIKKRCAHGTRLTLTLFLGRTREIWDDCTRVYSRHSIGSAAGATSGGVKRRRTGGRTRTHVQDQPT